MYTVVILYYLGDIDKEKHCYIQGGFLDPQSSESMGVGTLRLFIVSDTSFQLQDLYSGTLEKVVNQCGVQYAGIAVRSWVSFSSSFMFFFSCGTGCQTKGAHFTAEQHS